MDPGRKKFVYIAAGIVLLVVLAFVIGSFSRHARVVREVTLEPAAFVITLPESGVIQYPQIQTISSQVSGQVGHIYVKAGQRVFAGQLLATLQNPQIASDARSSGAAYRAATAKAESAQVTDTTNVAQAQSNLEAARARLAQAQTDLASGVESGQGYGQTSAATQRAQANANYVSADATLREARRLYLAYRDLYANKAIARDQLDQAEAKYEEAQAAFSQASLARSSVGMQVSRSQAVLEDNLRSARDGYVQAQAALRAAEVESGSGDVAAAAAEAERAGAEYSFAQEQADAMQVRAPYDAIVLSVATEKSDSLRPLQPGDAIAVGQALVTLTARRAFVVRTRVDEQDVINVRLGERVRITGEDFPGRSLDGHVVEVAPIAESADSGAAARSVATTVAVDDPPAFLRDGMSVEVDIRTTDLRGVLVVPNDALDRESNAIYVIAVRDGVARRQAVRVGASNESGSVIVTGLRGGDVIVAPFVTGLTDGTPVASPPPGTVVQP